MAPCPCFKWMTTLAVISILMTASSGIPDDKVLRFNEYCSESEFKCCSSFRNDVFPNLQIDFNCASPEVVRIIPPPGTNQSSPFTLFLSGECITRLPENICDYPKIVSIRMASNSIEIIPSLSCLTDLVALDLGQNKIETIESGTFNGLRKLRIIDLKGNQIRAVAVNTFVSDLENLKIVRLRYNNLQTFEAGWIFGIAHEFCMFDVSFNQISELSNKENWKVSKSQSYGPGYVDLSHNLFTSWITNELDIYGITLNTLDKLVDWGFDFRDNPLICDCKMYSILYLAQNFLTSMQRGYFEVYCRNPPKLNGTLVKNLRLDTLVCNVSDKCPSGCLCQDQPAAGQMLVDCSHGDLDQLPLELPEGNLKLLFGNNSITKLNPKSFLSRVHYLDISNNGLKQVDSSAIRMLLKVDYLNLSNNGLLYLPKDIVDISCSHLDIDNNPLLCSCNTTWLAKWLLRQRKESNATRLTCALSDGTTIPAFKADDKFLQCRKRNPFPTAMSVVLGILLAMFISAVAACVVFRYELIILLHENLQKLQKPSVDDVHYDMFVSADNDCEEDRVWSGKTLLPDLEEKRGLRLYFPPRDMDPGCITTEETINVLKKSRTVLVVLSNNYLDNPTKICEFFEAYRIMLKQRRGLLIIVRFSDVRTAKNGYLNGFLRLKKYLDFNDRELYHKITCDVERSKSLENITNSRSVSRIKLFP